MNSEIPTSAPADAHQQSRHTPSLSERLYSTGLSALHSVENKVHDVEHYVAENPRMSAAVGVATAAAVGIAALATRGKAAEIGTLAEDALLLSTKEGATALTRGGELASEASTLMSASTLRRATAVGIVPLAALTLAGCEDSEEVKAALYKNPNECTKDGVFTKEHCDEEYAAAKKLHDETSPKFKDQKDCEDSTGVQCTQDDAAQATNSSTNMMLYPYYYRPFMYGFMASQNRSADGSWRSTPIYSGTKGAGLVTSHGESIGTAKSGSLSIPSETFEHASKPVSTGAAHETAETEAFSHGAKFVAKVGGVSRGAFGGEAGGVHEGGGFHESGGFHASGGSHGSSGG